MKKLLNILLILVLFSSCSYTHKLNKWCKRCPSIETHDTIKTTHDSIVYKDSIIEVTLPPLPNDTIEILIPYTAPSTLINIPVKSFKYDYVSVDVWVKNSSINVKPYINNDKINVLIRNARKEVYSKIFEQYKNYKATIVKEKYIPWWVWFLWGLSLAVVSLIVAFIIKAGR